LFKGEELTNFLFPLVHATLVDHNGGEPGFKGRCPLKPVDLLKDSQKRILYHVLCGCVITQNDARQIVYTMLVMEKEGIEGIQVSLLTLAHNLLHILHDFVICLNRGLCCHLLYLLDAQHGKTLVVSTANIGNQRMKSGRVIIC